MFYSLIGSVLAFAFALTVAADAAEVKREIKVKGEKAEIWTKIGGWCAIANWHPVVAKCEEKEDDGRKLRTLTTKDGGVIKETMLRSSETGYTYQIDESPLPVSNYTASFALMRHDEDQVHIIWSARFEPKGASQAAAEKVIDGIFRDGLAGIEKASR